MKNPVNPRWRTVIWWFLTIWLGLGMLSTGLVQLFKGRQGQGGLDMLQHLRYPAYLVTLLGTWKILGVIALLLPGLKLVKEWAYAGFFFVMTGAVFSHVAVCDPLTAVLPSLLLLLLTVFSWLLRPPERRIVFTKFML